MQIIGGHGPPCPPLFLRACNKSNNVCKNMQSTFLDEFMKVLSGLGIEFIEKFAMDIKT